MTQNTLLRDNRAVSPVIGVILMVAITVILAAVIGAFVLGLGDSVGEEATAAFTISEDADTNTVTITLTNAGNADSYTLAGDVGILGSGNQFGGVGSSVTLDVVASGSDPGENEVVEGGQVSAIAEIDGGSTTVVQTFEVTISAPNV